MDARSQVEQAIEATLSRASSDVCPPGLAAAVRYAVMPGGARVRPLLCLGVASACGEPGALTLAAAASIELLHCASLVHDDLPCFDDADMRRGKPSVHRVFGEPMAVLTGDALIVLAFDALAVGCVDSPRVLPSLVSILSRAVGMSGGLVAGQAWESEEKVSLASYHAAKTGSLFVAAAKAGAASAGADPAQWETFGALLGEAYQVADDIRDASSTSIELGKPVGRDAMHARPSAVAQMGFGGAMDYLDRLIEQALRAVPACPRAAILEQQVRSQTRWFVPDKREQVAAA
jgi:geranylgeranyl diphosphate synthase type II